MSKIEYIVLFAVGLLLAFGVQTTWREQQAMKQELCSKVNEVPKYTFCLNISGDGE